MSASATGGATATAAGAAAIANAIKASGAIVRVSPHDFAAILEKAQEPLVVCAEGRFLSASYQYLTGYKGLVFYTKSKTPFTFSPEVELVMANKIWIPS